MYVAPVPFIPPSEPLNLKPLLTISIEAEVLVPCAELSFGFI